MIHGIRRMVAVALLMTLIVAAKMAVRFVRWL